MPAKGTPDRAVVLIDGNNWFHGLDRLGEAGQKRLNYAKVSQKLLGPRQWVETRYYVGRVEQTGNPKLYAAQRSFTARLTATDKRITVHYGRIEARPAENILADELLHYVAEVATGLDLRVRRRLESMANAHKKLVVYKEKATDVFLAVDLVRMALDDEYDAAYILSADGDYTPAVQLVRARGKRVYGVSATTQPGAQLAAACNSFIRVDSAWLVDCY